MGRMYSIPISSVGVPGTGTTLLSTAAGTDVYEIKAAANKAFILHGVFIGQTSDYGDAQAEGLGFEIKRGTGSYTSGSGGGGATANPHLTNDPACSATILSMNTTRAAAGGGGLTLLYSDAWNEQSGMQYCPIPEDRYMFLGTEGCIISVSSPIDPISLNATAIIEEL